MSQTQRYRFRPRYRGIAAIAAVVGVGLLAARAVAPVTGVAATFALAGGLAGVVLAALYMASPAWRIEVVITDEALEVLSSGDRRFRLAWSEVARVVASPATRTCFVDGGAPDRSLLVPGVGAPAPYDIADKAALYDAIVARAPAGAVVEVDLLETADLDGAGAEDDAAPDATHDAAPGVEDDAAPGVEDDAAPVATHDAKQGAADHAAGDAADHAGPAVRHPDGST